MRGRPTVLVAAVAAVVAVVVLAFAAWPRGEPAPDGTDVPEAALRRLAGGLLAILVPGALIAALLLERLVPAVFGDGYEGAVDAFGPALALVVLAPLTSLAVQAAWALVLLGAGRVVQARATRKVVVQGG